MTDKKLTDNDIVKALECCTTNGASCKDCPAFVKVDRSNCKKYFRGALDLINRQNSEIERLNKILVFEINSAFERGKAEANKEFAEEVKNEILNRLIKKSQAVKEWSEKYNINTKEDVVSLIYNSEIIALSDAIEIIDSLKLNKKREEI